MLSKYFVSFWFVWSLQLSSIDGRSESPADLTSDQLIQRSVGGKPTVQRFGGQANLSTNNNLLGHEHQFHLETHGQAR